MSPLKPPKEERNDPIESRIEYWISMILCAVQPSRMMTGGGRIYRQGICHDEYTVITVLAVKGFKRSSRVIELSELVKENTADRLGCITIGLSASFWYTRMKREEIPHDA